MESLVQTIRRASARWRSASSVKLTLDEPPPAEPFFSGREWNGFEIIEKSGQGAFGHVYRARDLSLNRQVGLKFLNNAMAISEGRLLARLSHPNVVAIHGCLTHDGATALVMEWVEGRNLERFVEERGVLDPVSAAVIGLELCRGLAYVHKQGLIHRDIKAANVIRKPDGHVVLVDFGLGSNVAEPDRIVGGTLPYMAPELFESGKATIASDIYALGCLMFYLVSASFPVSAQNWADFAKSHESRRRARLMDVRPELPAPFAEIVEKALEFDPTRRFQSAGDFAAAFQQYLIGKRSHLRKSRTIAAVAAIPALVVLAWKAQQEFFPTIPKLQLTRLTSAEGLSRDPTMNADGTLLAYASDQDDAGNLDIYVQQLPNGGTIRVTNSPCDDTSPAFSPDGHWIAYRSECGSGALYVVGALGGTPRLVAKAGFNPRFSPDGKYLAYWTGEGGHTRYPVGKLWLAPATGGEPRQLAASLADARLPIWSPDSKSILFQGSPSQDLPPDRDAEWWLAHIDGSGNGSAPVNTGALAAFHSQGLEVHTRAAYWYGDYVIFSAAREANVNLWRARLFFGPFRHTFPAQRLTFGAAFETTPWVSSGGRIVFADQQSAMHIWSYGIGEHAGEGAQRLTNTIDLEDYPSISRDGRWLIYGRNASEIGTRQIWARNLEHREDMPLTVPPGSKQNPLVSPDGESVVYSAAERDKEPSVFLVTRIDRRSRRICEACGVVTSWHPRENELLVSTDRGIERLNLSTGARSLFLSRPGWRLEDGAWSPDGTSIAFSAHQPGAERHVYIAQSNAPAEWRQLIPDRSWNDKPHWSEDGKSIYFFSGADDFPCIWESTLSTPPVMRPILHFHNTRRSPIHLSQPVRNFALSRGRIYINLPDNAASVWMSQEEKSSWSFLNFTK